MNDGMMMTALKNLLFMKRQTEDIPILYEKKALMPLPDGTCTFCRSCADACRTEAISISDAAWMIDLGRCIFCRRCSEVCENGSIKLVNAPDYVLKREDLIFRSGESTEREKGMISEDKRAVFGRSIDMRKVDTGSCNACEIELNSLFNPFYDIERFGLKLVASPRHADVLLVTGPLTDNMKEAFGSVIETTPDPKVIIASGTCAISGGLFSGGETSGGIDGSADVDIFIPGCPPAPDTVTRALLSALGLTGRR